MKNTKKLISVLLVAMLLITTVVSAGISVSAVSGTLTSYYSTNGSGYGKEKTITVDGDISDWDSSMLIAQGTANDDPRVYRPNSMYELAEDLYALYAAYDNSNLYLMWEMTNVQDIVSPLDDYPLTQGILYETSEFPLFIFIDTGKSSDAIGNQGKTTTGGTLWDKHITTDNVFNRVIATDVKGNNGPWMYGGDASGVNPVEMYNRTTSGITIKYGKGILSSKVNGINKGHGEYNGRVPGDVCNASADWVEFNSLGHKSSTLDFHYEVSIPLEKLGITKSDITSNGIGAMLVITSGMSGMDSLPYDLSMSDQADLDDGEHSHENNSFEKSDDDHITAPFARIGAQGNAPTAPTQPSQPQTEPTTPSQQTDPPSSTDLTVNAKSNFFPSTTQTGLNIGDKVSVRYDLTANKAVASTMWHLDYDSSKLRLLTSANSLGPAGGTVNADGNPVYGNFTNVNNPLSFNSSSFLEAEFEVLATGVTDVNLTIDELNLMSNGTLVTPVENGVVMNVSGVTISGGSVVTPGGDQGDTININAKSNFFDLATAEFDKTTGNITVAYRLKTNMPVVNAQWVCRYDSSKLQLESAVMPAASSSATILTPATGVATGNFTNLSGVKYSSLSDFAVFTFKPIGAGTANVNLEVVNLAIGYIKNNVTKEAYLVDSSVVNDDIIFETGFGGFEYSNETKIYASSFKRGDVDGNGSVDLQDATLIQRYLAEYSNATLTANQLLAADANADGRVNIMDVTTIQRYKAGIISKLPA